MESSRIAGVVVDLLLELPRWVHVGAFAGAVVSVVVAGTFLVGARLMPDAAPTGHRWSTEARRRDEIRSYLEAIDERYIEDADLNDSTVAFYLPRRDVAVTFDARTFIRLDRTSTHVVLVEHELSGIQLGHRLPFETPSVGAARTTAHGATPARRDAAYDVLGIPIGASSEEIRAAYRERVKEAHPDHGGDEAAFREVQEAYQTVSQAASSLR